MERYQSLHLNGTPFFNFVLIFLFFLRDKSADGLIVTPVGSYAEIEQKMDEGTMNRTVAATNMNATSRLVEARTLSLDRVKLISK